MRILGIDYGSKRLGLAISDPLGITAQPLKVLTRDHKEWEAIAALISEKEISYIVIGLPRNMDGSEAVQYENVLEFVKELETKTELHVETWDERLTTAQAERLLISNDTSRKKRKKAVDMMAATLILQSFMDANPEIVNKVCGKI